MNRKRSHDCTQSSKARNNTVITATNKTKTKVGTKKVTSKVAPPELEVKNSFYSKAKHLIGSVDSGVGDLSTNKAHLAGFGQSKNAHNR
jgi:hypothetical protein